MTLKRDLTVCVNEVIPNQQISSSLMQIIYPLSIHTCTNHSILVLMHSINSVQSSQITDVPLVEGLQSLNVVLLELSPIGSPSLVVCQKLSVGLLAQFHHLVQFLLQAGIVGSNLADDLISIQAEDELGLGANAVVPGNFRGDIAVHLDHLQKAIFAGEVDDVLVGDFALGVPAGAEVDEQMGVFVLEEMGVEGLETGEVAQVGVAVPGGESEHQMLGVINKQYEQSNGP